MSLARVRDLRFRFGSAGPLALDGLDLDVAAGEVVLLEGPSGAGKSTLLRALGGLLPEFHGGRMEGRIAVCGHHVGRVPAARIARVASLAFQDPEAQAVMAGVERDVAFGPECLGRPRAEIGQTVAWALAQAGAAHLRHRSVTELSGGERQRVALAAVLAMRPRLLLLDEPTSQLDDDAAQGVLSRIRALADATGMGVVIAEHRADRAHPVVDRIVPIAPGAAARAEGSAAPAATAVPAGPEVARLEGVRAAHGGRVVLEGAGLSVRAGEVTALVGPSGSGKTTLLRVLAGLHAPAAGAVRIAGEDVTRVPPERRFPRIGMVPQAPGRHLLRESVEDELALTLRNLGVAATERRTRVDREMDRHALRHLRGRHPLDLSVGERERVAIAATLVARPDLLALDEPTRGVDPIARRRIGALMRAHAAGGGAVLVATHDPHLVREWCDRTVHVDHGRLAAPAGAAR